MSKWIHVTENLPKVGKEVLVCSEHGQIGIGHLLPRPESHGDARWYSDSINEPIIYWQKLPKPPELPEHKQTVRIRRTWGDMTMREVYQMCSDHGGMYECDDCPMNGLAVCRGWWDGPQKAALDLLIEYDKIVPDQPVED